MCGIVAIAKNEGAPYSSGVLDRMRDAVAHRGPNGCGRQFFLNGVHAAGHAGTSDSSWNVGLGHRRLAILDLSPAGRQPMVYRDRFWIVYNGEVFNYVEVRAELEGLGHTFRSSSDTEVILAAYSEWGVQCFARLRGMWGLVIYDTARDELILCRDRLGIKPLYRYQDGDVMAVVSEIKQLQHLPGFRSELDQTVAAEYLETGYEDSQRSFFKDVQPITAGTWQRFDVRTLTVLDEGEYWHPERIPVSVTDANEAGEELAARLRECVGLYLRSDVPVGCALSGGLDSSSIAIIANDLRNSNGHRDHAFQTFTLTCPGDASDERAYANEVVAQIDARSHFVTIDADVFLEDLDSFVRAHDEPVGALSMYAAYCLARLTRASGVPVTLNGQGGDEALSGYWQSYFLHLRELWKRRQWIHLAQHFVGAASVNGNPALLGQIPVMLRRYHARRNPPITVKFRGGNGSTPGSASLLQQSLDLDGQHRRIFEMRALFLPRLLKWDDRNFMAFSVESRYPFLDHELIDLCLSFSPRILYQRGWTKFPLRLGLRSHLPPAVRDRRSKFGFETPQDKWLRGPLRPTLERWLRSTRPIWDYVDRSAVQRLADDSWRHGEKRDELGQALFRLFVFDRWLTVCGVRT